MAPSAIAQFSAVQAAGVFNYEFAIENTSPAQFEIYAIILGAQFDFPGPDNPTQLNNVAFISNPSGWSGSVFTTGGGSGPASANAINWGTNFQGSGVASGYILPGNSGRFTFQTSSPPPPDLVFGCCYYDNANPVWGFCTNGTANLVERMVRPKVPTYNTINPLVLVLGDDVFVRLNLPRPLRPRAGLLESLSAGIKSMNHDQRVAATHALDAHIEALTAVRSALDGPR